MASDPKPEAALGNWKLPSGNTSRGEGSAPCDSVPGSADKDEPEACWASPPPPNFWLKDTLRLISLLQECLGHPEAHTGKGCGSGPRVCQGCVPRRDLKGDWAGIGSGGALGAPTPTRARVRTCSLGLQITPCPKIPARFDRLGPGGNKNNDHLMMGS